MMTRIYQIKHSEVDNFTVCKGHKDCDVRQAVEKIASKKDRELIKTILSDLPAEQINFSHNFD